MPKKIPPQHQNKQPGRESEMYPTPESLADNYEPAHKLRNKVAIITGGDSGIGRAIAYLYALEGANLTIVYLEETDDAKETEFHRGFLTGCR